MLVAALLRMLTGKGIVMMSHAICGLVDSAELHAQIATFLLTRFFAS